MKKFTNISILTTVFILFTISACDNNEDILGNLPEKDTYPSLKVVNENIDSNPIVRISLNGYEFTYLNIEANTSQTFTLDQGLSGGYDNINIKVTYERYRGIYGSTSTTVDFRDGGTTTITLKGCIDYEGCRGIYLE